MKVNESLRMFIQQGTTQLAGTRQGKNTSKKDSIEISSTSKAFDKVNKFLNLGRPDRLDISDLNPEEKEEFVKMIAALVQKGIIGYEIREVDGKPEKHYFVNEIGDERLYGTKLYNRPGYYDEK